MMQKKTINTAGKTRISQFDTYHGRLLSGRPGRPGSPGRMGGCGSPAAAHRRSTNAATPRDTRRRRED